MNRKWIGRNGLNLVLLLVAAALALSVYTIVKMSEARSASILRDCQEQNTRHANTIRALDGIYARAFKQISPAKWAQLRASETSTVLIIDALAPYQNCQQITARASRS